MQIFTYPEEASPSSNNPYSNVLQESDTYLSKDTRQYDDAQWQIVDFPQQSSSSSDSAPPHIKAPVGNVGAEASRGARRTAEGSTTARMIFEHLLQKDHYYRSHDFKNTDGRAVLLSLESSPYTSQVDVCGGSSDQAEYHSIQAEPTLFHPNVDSRVPLSHEGPNNFTETATADTRSAGDAIWKRRSDKKKENERQSQSHDALEGFPSTRLGASATRYKRGLGLDDPCLELPRSEISLDNYVELPQQASVNSFDLSTVDALMAEIAKNIEQKRRSFRITTPTSENLSLGRTYQNNDQNNDIAATHGVPTSVSAPVEFTCVSMLDLELRATFIQASGEHTTTEMSSRPSSSSSSSHHQLSLTSPEKAEKSESGTQMEKVKIEEASEDTKAISSRKSLIRRSSEIDAKDPHEGDLHIRKKSNASDTISPLPYFKSDNKETGPIQRVVAAKGSGVGGTFHQHSTAKEGEEIRHQCPHPTCDKHYSTSGHARRHSRYHVHLRPFLCPVENCNSTFTRRDNCSQHQKSIHATDGKLYVTRE
ncbi:hypothetical protein CBS101457_004941 [Exobasidium rhododendri]|nr:hypothetical protein CBS101457_004941 [Exobasidium rhododendri]